MCRREEGRVGAVMDFVGLGMSWVRRGRSGVCRGCVFERLRGFLGIVI